MRTTGESEPKQTSEVTATQWRDLGGLVRQEDDRCWVCGAEVVHRHCKIICPRCGFMRDCSDP